MYPLKDVYMFDPKSIKGLTETGKKSIVGVETPIWTEYITDFAEKVHTGAFDLEGIWQKSDEEAIRELSSLKGIGVWTAEMILLFCMQRPDVLSYDDLATQRALPMAYHHLKTDRRLFEKYRRRFSPYGSVASLYLWAVSGGAVPELHDYAPKEKK